jgi:hypothetical protein
MAPLSLLHAKASRVTPAFRVGSRHLRKIAELAHGCEQIPSRGIRSRSQSRAPLFFATRRLVAYSLAGTEGCLSR